MKLRIISGELKGRYITVPDDMDFRPTQERIRESVSEIVKRRIWGAAVADLCAGSGAMGFEMISRGAVSVDFVDADKRSIIKITENAKALGVDSQVRVICDDVGRYLENRIKKYDIIFYDPPYDNVGLQSLVPKLLPLLKDDGLLIYERRRNSYEKKYADTADKKNVIDARIFSDTVMEFYSIGKCCNNKGFIPI